MKKIPIIILIVFALASGAWAGPPMYAGGGGGAGTPGGSPGDVQCNNGGAFGGCTNLTNTLYQPLASLTGSSLTVGKVYYRGASALTLAEADSASTLPAICLAVSTTSCVFSGVYTYGATQGWTAGNILYVSASSAGALVTTAPSTVGQFVQRVGVALAADTILIMPSLDVGGL